jgi:hypothetical protein
MKEISLKEMLSLNNGTRVGILQTGSCYERFGIETHRIDVTKEEEKVEGIVVRSYMQMKFINEGGSAWFPQELINRDFKYYLL